MPQAAAGGNCFCRLFAMAAWEKGGKPAPSSRKERFVPDDQTELCRRTGDTISETVPHRWRIRCELAQLPALIGATREILRLSSTCRQEALGHSSRAAREPTRKGRTSFVQHSMNTRAVVKDLSGLSIAPVRALDRERRRESASPVAKRILQSRDKQSNHRTLRRVPSIVKCGHR